jgi:hypothetical protein
LHGVGNNFPVGSSPSYIFQLPAWSVTFPQINNHKHPSSSIPAELEATLYPDELVTHILLITNTGETPLSYTIYEMTASLGLTEMVLQRHAVPVVAPEAQSQITQNGEALVIISLRETPDLSAAYSILEKATRRQYVYNRLLETASRSQELFKWLESQGSQPQRLLAANAITAVLNKQQLTIVAENPQVRSIQPNQQFSVTPSAQTTPTLPRVPTVSSAQPDTVSGTSTRFGRRSMVIRSYRHRRCGGHRGYGCDVRAPRPGQFLPG